MFLKGVLHKNWQSILIYVMWIPFWKVSECYETCSCYLNNLAHKLNQEFTKHNGMYHDYNYQKNNWQNLIKLITVTITKWNQEPSNKLFVNLVNDALYTIRIIVYIWFTSYKLFNSYLIFLVYFSTFFLISFYVHSP